VVVRTNPGAGLDTADKEEREVTSTSKAAHNLLFNASVRGGHFVGKMKQRVAEGSTVGKVRKVGRVVVVRSAGAKENRGGGKAGADPSCT
jgi:hypothetical protein